MYIVLYGRMKMVHFFLVEIINISHESNHTQGDWFFSLRVMPLDSNIITNQKKLILNMCRHVADYVRDESCLMELCRSLICHLFIFDTIQILFAHLFFLFIIHWRTHSLCIQSVQGLVRTGSLPIQTVHWSWYWSLNELMPIFVRYQYFHKSSFLRPPNKW